VTDFRPTDGQAQALDMVRTLLQEEGAAFAVLSGYAGTGKTTLLRVIAEEHGDPQILTPTGKAALRVAEATGRQASTIHRWLYKAVEDPKTGETKWEHKGLDEIPLPGNQLVVIDEASMVGKATWEDIWGLCSSIGLKVLLVGDRFQLGPVTRADEPPFNALVNTAAHYRTDLVEVCRQALDSPIIRASMLIRKSEDGTLDAFDILEDIKGAIEHEFLKMAPSRALIAHKNTTRQRVNLEVRKILGYNERDLVAGEPLLVLFNNYHLNRFNGEVVEFQGWKYAPKSPVAVTDRFKNLSTMMGFGIAKIEGANAILSLEEVFAQTQGMPETTVSRAARGYARDRFFYESGTTPGHLNANLGYCLTAHKAQGSEWDDVLVVIEPSIRYLSFEGRRWLYTAITRAKKNVRITFI
jgi:ATP-dependent exoDNAse (exonuclease V) alpha subunit